MTTVTPPRTFVNTATAGTYAGNRMGSARPDAGSFVTTRARSDDCDTSKTAAQAAVSRKASSERVAIVQSLKIAPMGLTAREIAINTQIDYITVQRRISECGMVKSSLRRGGCAVWVAV